MGEVIKRLRASGDPLAIALSDYVEELPLEEIPERMAALAAWAQELKEEAERSL